MRMGTDTDRRAGLWQRLRGRRHIDPPLRLVIAILALASVIPPDLDNPLHLLAQILSAVLLILAIPFPTTTLGLGIGAHLFWMLALPFERSTVEVVVYGAIGVLCSHLRWIRGSIGIALIIGANILGSVLGHDANTGFASVILLCLLATTLGISSGLLERNLGREIFRREHSALEAGQRMERMRQRIAIDAHDTLSHSLSTESSILTTILHTPELPSQVQGPLTELYVVNSEAQVLLRGLLGRLNEAERHGERPEHTHDEGPDVEQAADVDAGAAPLDLAGELARTVRTIGAATAASAIDLRITLDDFAILSTQEFATQCQLLLRELTTNIIEHGRRGASSSIAIELDERWSSGPWLHLESENAVNAAEGFAAAATEGSAAAGIRPRSVDLRTRELGGTVEVSATSAGILTIRVSLPIPAAGPAPGQDEAR